MPSVRLRDSLSNPSEPLKRLFAVMAAGSLEVKLQVTSPEVDPAVATEVRECRMLSPDEVTELVEAYRRGASERELARRYGVHRHTVDRHLERAAVSKRPKTKMTPSRVVRAMELYGLGWGTARIGRELGVSGSTVWQALKRVGVKMRPPVA